MMHRTIFLMFVVLSILSIVFSADMCIPNSIQVLKIKVLDINEKPVENAYVKVRYFQSSTVTPLGIDRLYVFTPLKPTDHNGDVEFNLVIKETHKDKMDCSATIYVEKFGKVFTQTIDLSDMPIKQVVRVPFAYLKIRALKDGNPVYARFLVGNMSKEDYYWAESVPIDTPIEGYVVYEGVKRYFNITINNTTFYDVSFDPFTATIEVVDSFGRPLSFSVFIDGKEFKGNGKVEIPLPFRGYKVKIKIDDEEIVESIYKNVSIVVDREKPEIDEVNYFYKEGLLYVRFQAIDPGNLSSGIDDVNVYVVRGSLKDKIGVKKTGHNYEVVVVPSDGDTTLQIEILDKEGNKRLYEITVPAFKEAKEENVIEENSNIHWLYVIGGIIFIVVVVFAYFKFREVVY